MAKVLYKVVAKRNVGRLPAGANVEIMSNNLSSPNVLDIVKAFEEKYGMHINYVKAYFEITKC